MVKKITLRRILRFTKGFMTDRDRKSLREFIEDYKFLKQKGELRESIKIYTISLMYKKDAGPLENYMLGKTYTEVVKHYQKNLGKDPVLEDKLAFRAIMKKHRLPHPQYLGKIESGNLYLKDNNQISLSEHDKFSRYIRQSLETHKKIFIKPVGTYGGKGIIKCEKGQPIDLSILKKSHYKFIIEKGITQHQAINKIYTYSVNSLRITTLNLNGQVGIAAAFLRMGVNKSSLDNLSTGGLFVNYDLKQNKLNKKAYQIARYGGRSYLRHPDTGFIFENTSLPYRDAIEDLILKAAALFPDIDMIGWDIAITPDGPLIIEGNSNATIRVNQIVLKGLKTNPLFREYLKQFSR